jgi:cation diffusion facilitator CzcD-associated flavoprotein CzcO
MISASRSTLTAVALSLFVSAQQASTENKGQLNKAQENKGQQKHFSAIVVGGTGATGRQVVKELLSSEKWSSVTVITRLPPNTFTYVEGREGRKKLDEKLVGDWSVDSIDMPKADAIFLCLGT